MDNYKYSEEWRHECEVQHIAKQPLKKRREILIQIGKVRGMESRTKIEQSLIQLWKQKAKK